MIGVDTFGSVFGGQPAHTAEHMTEHLRAVIRAGYSPVLCKPGGKETACILSAAQAKKADREFQQRLLAANPAARVNGRTHECGFKHVLDDPAKVGPIVTRFMERHGGLNVALHLGRSRMMVVDVDTPDERNAFERLLATFGETATDAFLPLTPGQIPGITVESPGSYDQVKQEWVHWGGGHWWMPLPEGFELPAGKVFKGPGGWAAMYGEAYALVPPATRPEGAYRLVGGTTPPPVWLLDQVTAAGAVREQVQRERQASAGGPIDAWSASTSWGDLLGSRGWLETSLVEGSCGCPVWTAPGSHSSPKSATAHDLGCARFDTAEGWGPLKIWTDNPPDGLPPEGAVTKLQFVSAVDHGGDDGAAIRALGIERAPVPSAFAVPEEWEQATVPRLAALAGQGPPTPGGYDWQNHVSAGQSDPEMIMDEFATPTGPPPGPSLPQTSPAESGERLSSWDAVDLGPFLDGTYVPPAPTLLARSDGQPLFYRGLTHSVYGETESAKSWIALLAVAQAIRAGEHALWFDLESDPGLIVSRLQLMGCTADQIKALLAYVAPWGAPGPDDVVAWFDRVLNRPYAVAVIDAMSGALGLFGLKSKDDDDITSFYRGLPTQIVNRTGAAVVVVDHVVKDKDTRGRWPSGSERKVSALTGAAFSIRRKEAFGVGMRGSSEIWIAKDRAGGLRGLAGPQDRDGMQQIGTFILDSSSPAVFTAQIDPLEVEDDVTTAGDVSADICAYLVHYEGATTRAIIESVTGKTEAITTALRSLAVAGTIRVDPGARGAHHHYLTDPLNIGEMSGSTLQ